VGPKRRALGQHFLRDAGIAAPSSISSPHQWRRRRRDRPRPGALTAELARRAGRVIALEVDRALAAELRERLPDVEVLDADARTWTTARSLPPAGGRVLVVGNLPYSVSKPIVAALVGARRAIDEMALMLQQEVASAWRRLPAARPTAVSACSPSSIATCESRFACRPGPSGTASGRVRRRPSPRFVRAAGGNRG